jgi:hypothetical protein
MFDTRTKPDRVVQQLWLAKILYGSRFVEAGLRNDVRDPDSSMISELETIIDDFTILRLALYAGPANIVDADFIGTFRQFRAGRVPDDAHRFDFAVPRNTNICGVRFGETMLLGSFLDGLAIEQALGGYFDAIAQLELHPLQCIELTARVSAVSQLLQHTTDFFARAEFTPDTGGFPLDVRYTVSSADELDESELTRGYHACLQDLIRGLPDEARAITEAIKHVPEGRMLSFLHDVN